MGDDDWELVEVSETPLGGYREAWAALVKQRPDLAQVPERDIPIDVVCGRDGISRHRFAVRAAPSPEPRPRALP